MMRSPILFMLTLCTVFEASIALADTTVWQKATAFGPDISVEDRTEWQEISPAAVQNGYAFPADVIVESGNLIAAFAATPGQAAVYLQTETGLQQVLRLGWRPFELDGAPTEIVTPWAGEDGGRGRPGLNISAGGRQAGRQIVFYFEDGLIEVIPRRGIDRIDLDAPLAGALIPDFVSGDLVYDAARAGDLAELHVPNEHALVGLVEGGDVVLTACWPRGDQRLRLGIDTKAGCIDRVTIEPAGRSLFIGLVHRQALWHAHPAKDDDYERTVAVDWRPPFAARWITQLAYPGYAPGAWAEAVPFRVHDGTLSIFTFTEGQTHRWKQTVGWFPDPCWFDRGQVFLHLGQKVTPAASRVLIYALERTGATPETAQLPLDLMVQAMGAGPAGELLGIADRKPTPVYRPDSVYGLPVCETFEELDKLFKSSAEAGEHERVVHVADDLAYYFGQLHGRTRRYATFADKARRLCEGARASGPEAAAFLELTGLERTAKTIAAGCNAPQVAGMLSEIVSPLDKLRNLGGNRGDDTLEVLAGLERQLTAQAEILDSFVARCELIVRGLAQKAAYRCVDDPGSVGWAEDIRTLTRECLKNPSYLE